MNTICKTKFTTHAFGYAEVSVTEWLVQDQTGSPGNTMEVSIEDEAERSISCVRENNDPLECVEGMEATNLNHAVTISEDGSITSVPLSQLAPIHLQLESKHCFDSVCV